MQLVNIDDLKESFEPSDFDDDCFENCSNMTRIINSMPTISLVYCKDCKHRPIDNRTKENSSNFNIEFPDGKCPCQCDDGWYSWYPNDDWFCGNGELKDE